MDETTKGKVKGLLLKSFGCEEIANLLQIPKADVEAVSREIVGCSLQENSAELYSELQKDLSKLVLTEINKQDRDSGVVLNAIRLQVEIQEKKLGLLSKRGTAGDPSKISKDYIYERDEKMNDMLKKGKSKEEIAKEFQVSGLSVEQAIDRCQLNLPSELRTLSPSIIAETYFAGIDKQTRLRVLWDAYNNNLTRKQVRDMMTKIKNDVRKQ
jgi:predicted DNA-binding protein YlxM (UPF0122 family)